MKEGASPVFGFLKQPSLLDFPGRISLVFFLSGCNFRCRYCHNSLLIELRLEGIAWERLSAVIKEAKKNWVDAAVITGGEPTVHPRLGEFVAFLKTHGLAVKLDTNGSRPEVLEDLLSSLDYVAMDLKAPLADYPLVSGFSDTDLISRALSILERSSVPYELRTTVVERLHPFSSASLLAALAEHAPRYVLHAFHPRDSVLCPELRTEKRTSERYLSAFKDLLGQSGCNNVIIG